MLSEAELSAIESAVAAMTPAPWREVGESGEWWIEGGPAEIGHGEWICVSGPSEWARQEDSDGVIALRNAAPRLLATIAQQRAIIATLRAAVEAYADEERWWRPIGSHNNNLWFVAEDGYDTARAALDAVKAMEGDDHAT